MPPNTRQAVRLYRNAMGFAPSPGFPARWPMGTGPTAMRRNFAGPIHSSAIHGLGDGDGLGDVITDALTSVFSPAVNSVLAPAEQQLADLKTALKAILLLSGIAALTGVVNMVRR